MRWTRTIGGVRISIVDVVMLLLAMFLAGCAPVATNVLNAATGDQLTLTFVTDDATACGAVPDNGLCVAPGDQPAQGVRLSVYTTDLRMIGEPCVADGLDAVCTWDVIATPTFVPVDADGVTASIVYRRAGSNRPYQEFAH